MVVFQFLNPLSSCGYCMRTFISQFSFYKAEYFILFVPVAGFLVLEYNYLDRHTFKPVSKTSIRRQKSKSN